jgi:hypothetical protein
MAGGAGWLYVVMHATTGIFYQQQYGSCGHHVLGL